jgi:hypothetical protein
MMMKETPVFNRTLQDLGLKSWLLLLLLLCAFLSVSYWEGLGKNPPKCFSSKSSVSDAFKEISRLCCNGLAIVDEGGLLIGNLSASDLKVLLYYNFLISIITHH